MLKILQTVLLVLAVTMNLHAQTNNERARAIADTAIAMMDEGRIEQAIKKLQLAKSIDPSLSYDVDYEIAYAHYLNSEPEKALAIFERISTSPDVKDQCFQMLGNIYDIEKQTEKAMDAYNRGLRKFPDSGPLHLEMGNMQMARENYNEAIGYYEKGISKAPEYPSNYYRTAQLFLSSDEEVWGMMYGELFMNLERNSKRTQEMSKWLFDTYLSEIKWTSDTSMSISFSKAGNTLVAQDMIREDFRMPFSTFVYESCLLTGVTMVDSLDYDGLCEAREKFLEVYLQQGHDEKYGNVLMSYQKKIKDAGHFNAYNHWLLMMGDTDGFDKWYADNKQEFEDFASWYLENPISITKENVFLRKDFL